MTITEIARVIAANRKKLEDAASFEQEQAAFTYDLIQRMAHLGFPAEEIAAKQFDARWHATRAQNLLSTLLHVVA